VTVNGKVASVDASNRFTATTPITSGANEFTVVATDAAGNQRTKIYDLTSSGTSRSFTYDANGNLTGDGTRTFEWDAENRLVAVNIGTHRSEFAYDGLDRRVRIVEKENGSTVRDANLFWDDVEIIEERLSTGEVNRFFQDAEQHNGAARYLTRDHLSSIREVTDTAGAVVTRNDYDPYGRITRVAGTEDSRFGYTGHMAHGASSLALALYRAYDPALGRWLSADPAGMIDGPNVHAYVRNRPSTLRDPLGLFVPAVVPIAIIIDWAIQAGLITAGVAITAAMIHDLTQTYLAEKKGKENVRDSGLERVTDEEVSRRARDRSLSGEERRRYQKEEKARGLRNVQKRDNKGQAPPAPPPGKGGSGKNKC
jgi:RHS repeat-associated protein